MQGDHVVYRLPDVDLFPPQRPGRTSITRTQDLVLSTAARLSNLWKTCCYFWLGWRPLLVVFTQCPAHVSFIEDTQPCSVQTQAAGLQGADLFWSTCSASPRPLAVSLVLIGRPSSWIWGLWTSAKICRVQISPLLPLLLGFFSNLPSTMWLCPEEQDFRQTTYSHASVF